ARRCPLWCASHPPLWFSRWPCSSVLVKARGDFRVRRVIRGRLVLRARKASKVSPAHKGHKGNKDHRDRPADKNRLAGPSLRLPTCFLSVVTLLSETLWVTTAPAAAKSWPHSPAKSSQPPRYLPKIAPQT